MIAPAQAQRHSLRRSSRSGLGAAPYLIIDTCTQGVAHLPTSACSAHACRLAPNALDVGCVAAVGNHKRPRLPGCCAAAALPPLRAACGPYAAACAASAERADLHSYRATPHGNNHRVTHQQVFEPLLSCAGAGRGGAGCVASQHGAAASHVLASLLILSADASLLKFRPWRRRSSTLCRFRLRLSCCPGWSPPFRSVPAETEAAGRVSQRCGACLPAGGAASEGQQGTRRPGWGRRRRAEDRRQGGRCCLLGLSRRGWGRERSSASRAVPPRWSACRHAGAWCRDCRAFWLPRRVVAPAPNTTPEVGTATATVAVVGENGHHAAEPQSPSA